MQTEHYTHILQNLINDKAKVGVHQPAVCSIGRPQRTALGGAARRRVRAKFELEGLLGCILSSLQQGEEHRSNRLSMSSNDALRAWKLYSNAIVHLEESDETIRLWNKVLTAARNVANFHLASRFQEPKH